MDSRALLQAAKQGDFGQLQILLQSGSAGLNVTDGACGATPLHWACDGGHVEAVRFLLQHHANPNAQSRGGSTPIQWATAPGSAVEEVVKLLLQFKADPTALENSSSSLPPDLALHRGAQGALARLNSIRSSSPVGLGHIHGSLPGSRTSLDPASPKLRDAAPHSRGLLHAHSVTRERITASAASVASSFPDSLDSYTDHVQSENSHLKHQLSQMRLLQAELQHTAWHPAEKKYREELESLEMQVKALEVRNSQLQRECQQLEDLRGQVRTLEEKNLTLQQGSDSLTDRVRTLEAVNEQLRVDVQEVMATPRRLLDLEETNHVQFVRMPTHGSSEPHIEFHPPSTMLQGGRALSESRSWLDRRSAQHSLSDAASPERQFTSLTSDLESQSTSFRFDCYVHPDSLGLESPQLSPRNVTEGMRLKHNLQRELDIMADVETRVQHFAMAVARRTKQLRGQRDRLRVRVSVLQGALGRQRGHSEALQHTLWEVQERLKDAAAAVGREDALQHECDCMRQALAKGRSVDAAHRKEIAALQDVVHHLQDQLRDAAYQPEYVALKVQHASLTARCHELTEEVRRLKNDLRWAQAGTGTGSLDPDKRRGSPCARLPLSGSMPNFAHGPLSPGSPTAPTPTARPVLAMLRLAPRVDAPGPHLMSPRPTPRSAFRDLETAQEGAYARLLAEQAAQWRRLLTLHAAALDALRSGDPTSPGDPLASPRNRSLPWIFPSPPDAYAGLGLLPSLYVGRCGHHGAAVNHALLAALPALPEDLRELDLAANYVGRRGVMCIADLLDACVNVTRVALSDNQLDAAAAVHLAGRVEVHPKLAALHLRNNGLAKLGGRALLRAVQVNTNLTSVVIEDERLLIPSLRERIEAQTLLNRQLKALTAAAH